MEEVKGSGTMMQKNNLAIKWDFSKPYASINKYYHFRHSRVFAVIFNQLHEFVTKEAKSQAQIQAAGQASFAKMTIEEFDKLSEEVLFGRICKEEFNPLFYYPERKIHVKYLEEYWINVPIQEISTELRFIQEY